MRKCLALCVALLLSGQASVHGTNPYDSSSLPNMIGDFSQLPQGLISPGGLDFEAVVSISGGASRTLVSRNNNVLPLTRAYFDYSVSDSARFDAATDARTGDIQQAIFGIEWAFFHDLLSVEIRLPAVNGYNDSQNGLVNRPALQDTSFGNMYFGTKALLYQDSQNVLTTGVGFTLPTGQETEYRIGNTTVVTIDNGTTFIQPFIAYAHTRGRGFLQAWTELDLAVGGNDLTVLANPRGIYQEQNLLHLDVQAGYWLYRTRQEKLITGFAPLLELHYTSTLNDTDSLSILQNYQNPFNRLDILNATIGSQINLGRRANCRLGVALPLLDGAFDEAHVADATFFAQFDLVRR